MQGKLAGSVIALQYGEARTRDDVDGAQLLLGLEDSDDDEEMGSEEDGEDEAGEEVATGGVIPKVSASRVRTFSLSLSLPRSSYVWLAPLLFRPFPSICGNTEQATFD